MQSSCYRSNFTTTMSPRRRLIAPSLLLLLLCTPCTATTIVAVRYGTGPTSGVVVGADTRTSAGGYVSNRFAAKLTFVLDRETDVFLDDYDGNGGNDSNGGNDKGSMVQSAPPPADASTCCVCRSGSAADTQALSDAVRTDLLHRHLSQNRRGTVASAARLLQTMIRNDPDLSASLICAGYDHVRGEGCIYSVSPGGTAMEEPRYAVQGSGSGYIYGYLEAGINGDGGGGAAKGKKGGRKVAEWSEEDAIEFVARVVGLAVERDGSSGGFCRIFSINRAGKKEYARVLHR